LQATLTYLMIITYTPSRRGTFSLGIIYWGKVAIDCMIKLIAQSKCTLCTFSVRSFSKFMLPHSVRLGSPNALEDLS